MTNFIISTDDGIQLAFPCHFHQVAAVLGQGLVVILGILAGNLLVPPHAFQSLEELVRINAVLAEDGRTGRPFLRQQRQINVLHADVFILEFISFLPRKPSESYPSPSADPLSRPPHRRPYT